LRAALENHTAAMKSHSEAMRGQRQTRNMLEELLDRDDGGMDENERARRQFQLDLLKRRWPPGALAVSAVRAQRQRQLQQRELVIRRIP
jgi:hypothetical protein